jgi:hypothetical protein
MLVGVVLARVCIPESKYRVAQSPEEVAICISYEVATAVDVGL